MSQMFIDWLTERLTNYELKLTMFLFSVTTPVSWVSPVGLTGATWPTRAGCPSSSAPATRPPSSPSATSRRRTTGCTGTVEVRGREEGMKWERDEGWCYRETCNEWVSNNFCFSPKVCSDLTIVFAGDVLNPFFKLIFRCRVDFKQAPTLHSEINLEIFGRTV